MADMRVIYLAHPKREIPAPELMVRFRCPRCHGEEVIDAFLGVPVCGADRVALIGVSAVMPAGFDPYAHTSHKRGGAGMESRARTENQ